MPNGYVGLDSEKMKAIPSGIGTLKDLVQNSVRQPRRTARMTNV
jgi:hypothetical protein